ncbi:MAG TPA: hypothetical protein VFA89_07005 [Terriglobales bacterium]|nr:hypothetical protein [Terriglobales bacterium]
MSNEIVSLAIFEPLAGKEAEALATFGELFAALVAGKYSRDSLLQDEKSSAYVLIRHWASDEARQAAMEDPEVLRCWAKLGHQIRIVQVYEKLEEVDTSRKGSRHKHG